MKQNSLRRLGALVLALALTLSLVPTGWAAPGDLTITGDSEVTIGNTVTLTAKWEGTEPGGTLTYNWSCTPTEAADLAVDTTDPKTVTVTPKGTTDQTATIMLSVTNAGMPVKAATHSLAIKAAAATNVPVTGVTLDKSTLTLEVGGTGKLNATVNPDNATNKTVTWSTSDRSVATVDTTGKVTAVKVGTATITATTADGGFKAECAVTVNAAAVERLSFRNGANALVRGKDSDNPWELTVTVQPTGADPGNNIVWSVANKDRADERVILELVDQDLDDDGKPLNTYHTGRTVSLRSVDPGEVTVTAQYDTGTSTLSATQDVTVSGIVLNAETTSMLVGETKVLAVANSYGYAASGNAADVTWGSSDPSTVTVSNTGELLAWKLGTVVITANKNGYSATCRVTVTEDEDAVIDKMPGTTDVPLSATHSEPLIIGTLYDRINEISKLKTQVLNADGTVGQAGKPLDYITNVSVSTDQGTLYYNYDSESNTGAGVGSTDRFSYQRTSTILQTLDKLYFVPRQGFAGTAEITFTGWSNGTAFPVTVRVEVKELDGVRYRTSSGEPAFFLGSDFNSYCRAQTGRDLSYVTFNLPQSSQGLLCYGYTSAGQYAGRVTTGTQYGRTGRNVIDDVCFVPDDAFAGVVRISFRGVDTAGASFTGEVVINVSPSGTQGEAANVFMAGQWGEPLALEPSLFNYACQSTIGDTLSYVRLELPAYDQGVLYYNYRGAGSYDSRVTASTRYYYSGTPGISGISFVPASGNAGRVAIDYTGYGVGGTSYTGKLYITLGEQERATVHYSVAKGERIAFSASDFNGTALLQLGVSLEYVEFQFPERLALGTLDYNYQEGSYNYPAESGVPYYRTASDNWQQTLNRISFHAGSTAGSVSIPFTGYTAADSEGERRSFDGTLLLQVGAASPADVTLSGRTSGQIWLSAYGLSTACKPVMNEGLSYIQITSLPSPEQGRLYYGYNGFKTGIEAKSGDRYYCMGSPNIDHLSFVPRGGFSGEAVVTYIGYSSDGSEQVSGKIVVNVARSTTTQLYNDMGRHGWAVDAVEFLSRNKTVEGVGNGRYNPTGQITKADFALMLVRAFGFTASDTVRFNDVPADSYYAQAASIAHQRGIAMGYKGNFEPNRTLTRQEAMLMVYRALKADNRALSNGLTANLEQFRDYGQIAPDAREAIGALLLLGVVQGNGDGTLSPLNKLNRAETASLMHALMTL